jgi:hypothetical protein
VVNPINRRPTVVVPSEEVERFAKPVRSPVHAGQAAGEAFPGGQLEAGFRCGGGWATFYRRPEVANRKVKRSS